MGAYMKRKLMLLGLCMLVVLVAFVYGIINKLDTKEVTSGNIVLRESEMIQVSEAIYLTGYFGIDTEVLTEIIGYNPAEYDSNEEEYLTYKEFRSLLESVCVSLEIKKSVVTKELSYDMNKPKDNSAVLIDEFLEFYQVTLDNIPEDKSKFSLNTMFVLGDKVTVKNDDSKVMITDKGKFKYSNALNYTTIIKEFSKEKDKNLRNHDLLLEDVMNKKLIALTYQNEILYVKEVLNEATVLHNVWIKKGLDGTVNAFLHDVNKDFPTKYNLSQIIENKIGDLTIEDGKIIKISIKPDTIHGKVLVADSDYIEIEKYGKLEISDNFKIYKIYGELGMEVTNNILVGYSATDFVVADSKIVAALIKEPIRAQNIRVLIKTDNFAGLFHKEVRFTSDKGITVTVGDKETKYDAGEEVSLKIGDEALSRKRVYIKSNSESGKIKLLSVNRTDGNPSYRGSMEIESTENGLIIINDVPIEEYLYAVVPSEMPSSYGIESLKVQAICARSYAYNQLFANGYSDYGAHVDDSVSYQVYNNVNETENSIQAVKETYGKVLEYDDKVITAYYFSTSSGHTASINEVWLGSTETEYLVGKLQTKYDYVDGEAVYVSSQFEKPMDFSTEDVFRNFIKDDSDTTYDSEFPWYRWSVNMTYDNLTNSVDKNLSSRYNASPSSILTLTSGEVSNNPIFESVPVSTIGKVQNVIVGKREKSGIISELILVGSKKTIKIISEYNIRTLLSPLGVDVVRRDKSKVSSLSLLPSAYFIVDKTKTEIIFTGGGYGHGVGMSQNGVKAMAESGKEYEEILKHYYTGVELGFIYE
jgi:stage II sporulation protein D